MESDPRSEADATQQEAPENRGLARRFEKFIDANRENLKFKITMLPFPIRQNDGKREVEALESLDAERILGNTCDDGRIKILIGGIQSPENQNPDDSIDEEEQREFTTPESTEHLSPEAFEAIQKRVDIAIKEGQSYEGQMVFSVLCAQVDEEFPTLHLRPGDFSLKIPGTEQTLGEWIIEKQKRTELKNEEGQFCSYPFLEKGTWSATEKLPTVDPNDVRTWLAHQANNNPNLSHKLRDALFFHKEYELEMVYDEVSADSQQKNPALDEGDIILILRWVENKWIENGIAAAKKYRANSDKSGFSREAEQNHFAFKKESMH